MSQRTQRIDELLRQEITAILAKEIADPDLGFATVTDVETSPDLRHARVWVSVIGQQTERRATVRALERAMVYVRRELGTRLRLKRIPELQVRLDDSAERGTRVLQLLADLEEGRTPDDDSVGESLPTPVARVRHDGDAPGGAGDGDQDSATPSPRATPRRQPRRTMPNAGGRRRAAPRRR
ncbi:MAG TPA: 30S ribosome-binding factor RbfA [Candidatus Limnocylindrales bacterium]